MSKTTPVRWWRDETDRYRSRGVYLPPAPDPAWMLERLAPMDPAMTRRLEELLDAYGPAALARACAVPLEILQPSPLAEMFRASERAMLAGTIENDPIADLKACP